mmetsp:Transcript_49864/g.61229  ORF Transcript_49864/g.61229 Transcript_49864/m.61229 type:complete len:315 (+) Transcript_49864:76-1020(+)
MDISKTNSKRSCQLIGILIEPNKKRHKTSKNKQDNINKNNDEHIEAKNDENSDKKEEIKEGKGIVIFNFKNAKFQWYLSEHLDGIFMKERLKTFCIGNDKNNKQVLITYKSRHTTLCSDIIDKAIKYYKPLQHPRLPTLKYCTLNYKCKCIYYKNKMNYCYNFSLEKHLDLISRKKKPNTYIEIKRNNKIIGEIYVITIKPYNLKRMAQANTVKDYRMSISQNVCITHPSYNNAFNLYVSKKNVYLNNFGIGIGYYLDHQRKNNIVLCLCLLNTKDTFFTVKYADINDDIFISLKDDTKSEKIFNSNDYHFFTK